MSQCLSLEQKILNPREQELLASIRKSQTKFQASNSKVQNISGSLKESNLQFSQIHSQRGDRFQQQAIEKAQRQQYIQEVTNSEIKNNSNSKKISNNSYKILIDKLERNLNDNLNNIDSQGTGQITFQQLGRLFTILEIFKIVQYTEDFQLDQQYYNQSLIIQSQEMQLHELSWKILSADQQVDFIDVKKVFCLFRIALDPAQLQSDKSAQLIKEYLEKIDEQQYDISDQIIIEFCKLFRYCTQTRLANTKIGYLKPQFAKNLIESYQNTLTFKPQVDKVSEVLENTIDPTTLKPEYQDLVRKYNETGNNQNLEQIQNLGRVDQLIKKRDLVQTKIQQLAMEKEQAELQQCTFKPQINHYGNECNNSQTAQERLYSFKTRFEVEQIQKEAQEQRDLQQLSACTFQPIIQEPVITPTFQVKSFDKTVQRMRMAIDQSNQLKMKKNFIPKGENYDQKKNLPFDPPKMLNRSKNEREQPILQINVNMGGGRIGHLTLKKDDNPIKAVKNFAKIWGISKDDISDLIARVNDEMQKIEEEDQLEENQEETNQI